MAYVGKLAKEAPVKTCLLLKTYTPRLEPGRNLSLDKYGNLPN